MSRMCWEINPKCYIKQRRGSIFQQIKRGEEPKCLAYNQRKGCWEVDWASEIITLSKEEKDFSKKHMKENCPNCPVYAEHQSEMDAIIAKVQKIK